MPRPAAADRKARPGQAAPADAAATDNGRAKRIGIREIAKLANVSVATVSMVLNNNPKITEATSKKVRRVMDQQGYRPNRIAQSLSSKYTRILAVMLPTLRHALADPYFGELISGICDRAARLGHKVIIEHAKPDFVKEKRHLELFASASTTATPSSKTSPSTSTPWSWSTPSSRSGSWTTSSAITPRAPIRR